MAKLAKRLDQVDASIARYLAALDRADREGSDIPEARTQRIGGKITALRRQMAFLRQMQEQVEASDDGQVSLTDPDARSMATSGRGTGIVGYDVQIAVDPEHHLVVAHDVVNEGHDRTQIVPMGGKAKQAIGAEEITVLADRGYYSGDEVLAFEGTGILPVMPRADTSGRAEEGLFVRADFVYDAAADHYVCPAGAVLTKSGARSDRHGDIDHYRSDRFGVANSREARRSGSWAGFPSVDKADHTMRKSRWLSATLFSMTANCTAAFTPLPSAS